MNDPIGGLDLAALGLNEAELAVLYASPVDVHRGLGSVVADLIAQVGAAASTPTNSERQQLGFIVRGLLSALAAERVADRALDIDPKDALVVSAMQVIYGELDDPSLTSRSVAAQLGVSVRTLQAAFGGMALSVSETIRTLRLERARVELLEQSDPSPAAFTAVGRRWGFHGSTHFVRAFERQYGVHPAEAQLA